MYENRTWWMSEKTFMWEEWQKDCKSDEIVICFDLKNIIAFPCANVSCFSTRGRLICTTWLHIVLQIRKVSVPFGTKVYVDVQEMTLQKYLSKYYQPQAQHSLKLWNNLEWQLCSSKQELSYFFWLSYIFVITAILKLYEFFNPRTFLYSGKVVVFLYSGMSWCWKHTLSQVKLEILKHSSVKFLKLHTWNTLVFASRFDCRFSI